MMKDKSLYLVRYQENLSGEVPTIREYIVAAGSIDEVYHIIGSMFSQRRVKILTIDNI